MIAKVYGDRLVARVDEAPARATTGTASKLIHACHCAVHLDNGAIVRVDKAHGCKIDHTVPVLPGVAWQQRALEAEAQLLTAERHLAALRNAVFNHCVTDACTGETSCWCGDCAAVRDGADIWDTPAVLRAREIEAKSRAERDEARAMLATAERDRARADEVVTKLTAALIEACNWVESGSEIIQSEIDPGDLDGEHADAKQLVAEWRALAGVAPERDAS